MPDQNPEASTPMVLYSLPSTISLQVVKSAPASKIGPSPEPIWWGTRREQRWDIVINTLKEIFKVSLHRRSPPGEPIPFLELI
jgi:hypothetical protein